ncbi:hypothetical protein PV382_00135 [Streptomyces scabiei]|uniref:hypothetical protein n=1 Tax=Streptomyces scabiei TaxID=1930 RepID=UPI000766114B|nr:hypothetical protein [Streptomyces scabiei]
MTFYRAHLDRGRNAYWAMEQESEELYETAQVLLDPETGSFTSEVSELLEYVGSGLLVVDRVTLDPPWRGHGLAAVFGCEANSADLPNTSSAHTPRTVSPSAHWRTRGMVSLVFSPPVMFFAVLQEDRWPPGPA